MRCDLRVCNIRWLFGECCGDPVSYSTLTPAQPRGGRIQQRCRFLPAHDQVIFPPPKIKLGGLSRFAGMSVPGVVSYCTRVPLSKNLKPLAWMALKETKTSGPPSSWQRVHQQPPRRPLTSTADASTASFCRIPRTPHIAADAHRGRFVIDASRRLEPCVRRYTAWRSPHWHGSWPAPGG